MTTESVVGNPVQARAADSFLDLWETINQIETILDIVNEGVVDLMAEIDPDDRRDLFNRHHNLIGAARTLAAELASKTRVR